MKLSRFMLAFALAAASAGPVPCRASDPVDDTLPAIASWQAPPPTPCATRSSPGSSAAHAGPEILKRAAALWPPSERPSGLDLLQRVVRLAALADEHARQLAEICAQPRASASLPAQKWLSDPAAPAWMTANLRLWYGRWLAQQSLFEEALEQLETLRPEDVVDPATLLFYQGVACHRLLLQDAGIEAVERLLERDDQGPRRYQILARLMQSDLRALKEDSLDHIARRMDDIERRLDLGRAGPKVRTIQDGVIKSLDKLIKDREAQQQQQQQQASQGGNMQPQSPAPDSTPMAGKGKGEVTRRNLGNQAGWGNLPPKQREEAMQQIGREFPSHYRDVVEQYFRKLATEGSQ